MNKVLIVGSTGMLGKPVANEFSKYGFNTTLLARNTAKTEALFPKTNVIYGDVFKIDSLQKAFNGHEIIYINLSVDPTSKKNDLQPEREGISNIIEVAKETGIKRLAYLSSLIKNYQGMNGFNWWSFDIKQAAVKKIKESEIPYSIFYPSTFMETFNKDFLQGNKLILTSGSIAPMWFMAAEDYAKQVVKAIEIAGDKNQEYIIQGPEAFTWDEAAEVFVQHYKKSTLKIIKIPLSLLKFLRLFNQKIDYGYRIMDALNNYPERFESEKTWLELGKPRISLKEYAGSF